MPVRECAKVHAGLAGGYWKLKEQYLYHEQWWCLLLPARIAGHFNAQYTCVDGNRVGEMAPLSSKTVSFQSQTVDSSLKWSLSGPDILSRGFVYLRTTWSLPHVPIVLHDASVRLSMVLLCHHRQNTERTIIPILTRWRSYCKSKSAFGCHCSEKVRTMMRLCKYHFSLLYFFSLFIVN